MPMPAAAPRSTSTSCPWRTSSRTPAGGRPTRYSCVFTSLGTPIFTNLLLCLSGGRLRERKLAEIDLVLVLHLDLECRQDPHNRVVEGDRYDEINQQLGRQMPREGRHHLGGGLPAACHLARRA